MAKRRFGDRCDGTRVRDVKGFQCYMFYLMNKRTDAEVYIQHKVDVTPLLAYLEEKNAAADYKTTVFHCAVAAFTRTIQMRPKLNTFIDGYHLYRRNEISFAFVAKKRFTDHAEETIMVLKPQKDDALDDISRKIVGDIHEVRESSDADAKRGPDSTLDVFAKLPRFLMRFVMAGIRFLDFHRLWPKNLMDMDTNFATVLITNLGSIKCGVVDHHLNNFGTNSILVSMGEIHKELVIDKDGNQSVRDILDFGITIDERIGDGFYFARSLKLINYLFANPTLLDVPLSQEISFEF